MPDQEKLLHIVLLHSNDIHGDFEETDRDGLKTGGLPLLSGYLQRVRREEKEVIYAIAGDMFMGSIIDREYRGLSTIKLTPMCLRWAITRSITACHICFFWKSARISP